MDLINAQISFLESRLVLIHIPINYYSFFLQPVLRLLFGDDHDEDAAKIPWTNRHDFLNITITPIECSVICSRELAERFFRPLVDLFNRAAGTSISTGSKQQVEISREDYIVVQVEGQGPDAGQRVLELTAPLAMAGISIFFLTTYFSDYILVPAKKRRTVTKALEQRGFIFSHTADAFVSQLSPASPTSSHHPRQQSSGSSLDTIPPPPTPPAKDLPELQTRTFARLKKNGIDPTVDRSLRLLQCAGSKEVNVAVDTQLKNDLLQTLLSTSPAPVCGDSTTKLLGLGLENETAESESIPNFSARFLSLTLTTSEPISVLLESRLAETLGSTLLGAKEDQDILIPITLDLRELPMEATGIVCGVAGRLAQGTISPGIPTEQGMGDHISPRNGADEGLEAIEISFLSTARGGTVIVKASELDRAVAALEEVAQVVAQAV